VYKTTISEAEQMPQTRRLVCMGAVLLALLKKEKTYCFHTVYTEQHLSLIRLDQLCLERPLTYKNNHSPLSNIID